MAALSGADTLADSKARVVTVAFGPGLNTAPLAGPSGPENHHIVPNRIEIDAGDVIEFVFAGFHQIRVYQKGVKLSDVIDLLPPPCRDNATLPACIASGFPFPLLPSDSDGDTQPDLPVYYEGISPIVAPLPVTINPTTMAQQVVLPSRSAAQNRSETVSFPEPGRYLVICAVIPHLNDKMYAWVVVKNRGNGHDH
jgi:plastocyanin